VHQVAKDPRRDIVYCSNAYDESMYTDARSRVAVENIHWLADVPPPSLLSNAADTDERWEPTRLHMKVRHGPKLVNGTLVLDAADPTQGDVRLDHVDSGLAPGQYIVFYNGTECLGGGIISERHWVQFVADHHDAAAAGDLVANDTSSL
jgi:tRNA-5-taurinomethyluridine 2-sulfurtransferase